MPASIVEILRSFVICKQPERYIGWPTAAITPNGEILVAFSGDREAHVCPFGKVQMVRSRDDANTWSAPETICDGPIDDRDAGITVTPSGALVIAWFTSLAFENIPDYRNHAAAIAPKVREESLGYWTRRSQDGGRTWEAPVPTRGSAPHGPISLNDGRLLYVGRRNPHANTELTVEQSTDDARSWQQIASIQTDPGDPITGFHEPHVVETTDGRLIAQFRYHGPDYATNKRQDLRQAESDDGGHSWTVAHRIPICGYPPHLLRLRDGRLLAVYGKRYVPFGEFACLSPDGGVTWDVENEIRLAEAINSDLGYPASVQLGDGSILTVYYQVDKPTEKTCLMGTLWRIA